LHDQSRTLEQVFDSLPGSLHRTNDCTMVTARIHENLHQRAA